jgi:dTDP-D-glucose 4,6-dehydratase
MSFDVSSASTISHLLTDEQSASKTVAVEVTTIDSFIHNHRHAAPVRVVKMDIEGFEILALKGSTELISRDQPLFLIEYALESGVPNSIDALHDFLAHHEYCMYALARTPAAFWRYETRLQKIQARDISCLDIKMLFLVPPSALTWFEAKEAEEFCSGV